MLPPPYEDVQLHQELEELDPRLGDAPSPDDNKPSKPQRARTVSIRRYIQSMVHASQCKIAVCKFQSCQKMKRMIMHIKICGRGANNGVLCLSCKQLIALCCYHARYCQEVKCLVPHCSMIKRKIKQLRLQA